MQVDYPQHVHQEWCTRITAALALLTVIHLVYTQGAETEGIHTAYLSLVRLVSVYS